MQTSQSPRSLGSASPVLTRALSSKNLTTWCATSSTTCRNLASRTSPPLSTVAMAGFRPVGAPPGFQNSSASTKWRPSSVYDNGRLVVTPPSSGGWRLTSDRPSPPPRPLTPSMLLTYAYSRQEPLRQLLAPWLMGWGSQIPGLMVPPIPGPPPVSMPPPPQLPTMPPWPLLQDPAMLSPPYDRPLQPWMRNSSRHSNSCFSKSTSPCLLKVKL